DRNRLINDREVRLTGLGSGAVTAVLTDAEISRLAGTRVVFHPGRVTVSAAGVDVGATVQVTNGSLSFGGLRLPIKFRVPRAPLPLLHVVGGPCVPRGHRVGRGGRLPRPSLFVDCLRI